MHCKYHMVLYELLHLGKNAQTSGLHMNTDKKTSNCFFDSLLLAIYVIRFEQYC